jgi:hypothetical protein
MVLPWSSKIPWDRVYQSQSMFVLLTHSHHSAGSHHHAPWDCKRDSYRKWALAAIGCNGFVLRIKTRIEFTYGPVDLFCKDTGNGKRLQWRSWLAPRTGITPRKANEQLILTSHVHHHALQLALSRVCDHRAHRDESKDGRQEQLHHVCNFADTKFFNLCVLCVVFSVLIACDRFARLAQRRRFHVFA